MPGTRDGALVTGLGWVLGALEIVFFVGCLSFGISQRHRRRSAFLVGGLIYLAVFTALVVANVSYAGDDQPSLFLSLPVPTAWMLYALWPAPLFFMAWFWINFDRRVLTPKSMERFRQIVEENRGRREGED